MDAVMAGCEPFSARGSRDGVLVLHGFTGNPQSMRPVAEVLANQGYSVELPRLPGHGTSVADMMSTTWADWSGTALATFDELASRCDRVAVLGLSMGGGLSCFVAENRPDVTALVLINPLVRPPDETIVQGLADLLAAGVDTFESIGSDIKKEGSVEASYPATPLRPAESLFAALGPLEAALHTITCPTLVLQSREDHVVTSDNGDAVVATVAGPVERIWLENSYHVATLDNDAALIEGAAVTFLKEAFAP